jgi:hypothetical protein
LILAYLVYMYLALALVDNYAECRLLERRPGGARHGYGQQPSCRIRHSRELGDLRESSYRHSGAPQGGL